MAKRRSVHGYLKRRRLRRAVLVVVVIAGLGVLRLIDSRTGGLVEAPPTQAVYEGKRLRVQRVVDGDTLIVEQSDGRRPTTRVRLWGVDCPEMPRPREGRAGEPFAKEATALARKLCEEQFVELELQSHSLHDRYGRLLAYVRLADGSLLNERLLEAGLARNDTRFPHDAQRMRSFQMLEDKARERQVGIWSPR